MSDATIARSGARIYVVPASGPPLRGERDALALLGDALGDPPDWIALPVARCGEAFFDLRTRILGEVAQKLVNYGLRLAIVGDVAPHVARSEALAAFVREANRGRQIWFVADLAELERRLAPTASSASPSRS
jgi:hypothetical protein